MAKLVQDASLTSVANAIRKKTGGTDSLTFPGGFVSAIEEITMGVAKEPYIEEIYDEQGYLINVMLHGYTKIRDHAFSNCTRLALTALPSEITHIGNNAFYNCWGLILTELPNRVTSIGMEAFSGCTKLALTALPSGVRSIDAGAFGD